MPLTSSKYWPYLLLLLASIPLFFLNMHNSHSGGGDDYAQYIKEAQNIAAGKPYYLSNYVFNAWNNCYSPPQYPPGFPLLLAPVVKLWGIEILPMCYFNTMLAVGLLLCFFTYFSKYAGTVAAMAMALLITYSGVMIDLKQSVLADVPSLLFVMFYLITRQAENFSSRRIALLILFAAMAILIRTQSILLVFAELTWGGMAVTKAWRKQKSFPAKLLLQLPSLYVVAGTLLLTAFISRVVFYAPHSATGFYIDFLGITLQKGLLTIVRDNISFLLLSITNFFHYETDKSIRTAMVTVMENCGLVFCIIGFIISVARRLSFDDIFFVLVCGLVLYYPIHDLRYFLPAIAIVFYYCYVALRRILPAVTTIKPLYIGLCMAVIYIVAGGRYLKSTAQPVSGYVPTTTDKQAFNYLITHISDSDIVLCARPRLITLYTNKRCMIHAWQYPMDVNKKVFDSLHVKYLLLVSGFVEDYYHTYLDHFQHPLDSVQVAPGYMLYTLR